MIKTAVITVSSSRSKGDDTSGKKIIELLESSKYRVSGYSVIKDEKKLIKKEIEKFVSSGIDIILTTGGTGPGPFDVTPEATLEVSRRQVPGISQLMRLEGLKNTKRAALSRGVSVLKGNTLIINLPGSPSGARESLSAVIDLLPHAVDVIKGGGH